MRDRWKERDERKRKAFFDLTYDAWRSGRNPDALSRDDFSGFMADGYAPEEITLNMMIPPKPPEPEPEYPEPDMPDNTEADPC